MTGAERPGKAGRARRAGGRLKHMEPLMLASESPRRRELLEAMGVPFEAVGADIEETEEGAPEEVVLHNALGKAEKVLSRFPDRLVLGADTVVVIDGRIFGKPADQKDAERMLRTLSGRWHEVYTGVALLKKGFRRLESDRTRVHFVPLTAGDIDAYIATGEPFGKAGAYAIQGRAGMLIDRIEGSSSNVIGLPQALVRRLLIQAEFNL